MGLIESRWIVWLAVALAISGLFLTRRFLRIGEPADQTVSIGAVYATFGVIYAVILGQVLVGSWDRYEATNAAVIREADSVDGIVQLAKGFPGPGGELIQAAAYKYGAAVVDIEFPSMAENQGPAQEAETALNQMYQIAGQMGAGKYATDPMLAAMINELVQLDDARGERLIGAGRQLPSVMWWTLVMGGVIAVGFTYLFVVQRGWIHMILVLFLAGTIGLLLSLIQAFSHPFTGSMAINPNQYHDRYVDEPGDPS